MTQRIYYTKPSITEREVALVTEAARTGWGEKCYEFIARFESGFAAHIGCRHAVATSSCTGALHLGLAALGIGRGDEVVLADTNWIATVAPVVHLGARPVFVDILPDNWCIDPEKAEAAITPRTRAIIAVHLYGNLCDMDRLLDIGRRRRVPVIEDAAEALGSVYRGVRAGALGKFATFSFHGSKTLTTGEGGMFVTDDAELHERVLTLANHGRRRSQTRQFWPEEIGFKYKMSNLQAAIGCAQLERIAELIAGKRRVFSYYQAALCGLPLRMNPEPADTINGYWMPTMVVDDKVRFDRERLLAAFRAQSIDGRVFFWPLSSLPMFERKLENVVSYHVCERAVNLPTYHDLTEVEMDRVVAAVKAHIG